LFRRARRSHTPSCSPTARPRPHHPAARAPRARLLEPDEPVRPPAAPEVVDVPGGHYPVHVRFSDVDVYGHVNNVKYFEYFQEARIQLMVASGRELGQGYHLVVAQTDVDYRRPILFRAEPYDCSTWVSHIGSTSVVFESVVRDGDDVLARAKVVGVCIDSATGRPAPVPEEFRDMVGAVTPSS
jgi:acyl-CoA thioester hydrolase